MTDEFDTLTWFDDLLTMFSQTVAVVGRARDIGRDRFSAEIVRRGLVLSGSREWTRSTVDSVLRVVDVNDGDLDEAEYAFRCFCFGAMEGMLAAEGMVEREALTARSHLPMFMLIHADQIEAAYELAPTAGWDTLDVFESLRQAFDWALAQSSKIVELAMIGFSIAEDPPLLWDETVESTVTELLDVVDFDDVVERPYALRFYGFVAGALLGKRSLGELDDSELSLGLRDLASFIRSRWSIDHYSR